MSKSEDQADQNQYQNQPNDDVNDQTQDHNQNQAYNEVQNQDRIENLNQNQPHEDVKDKEQTENLNQIQEQFEDHNQNQSHDDVQNQDRIENLNQTQPHKDVNDQDSSFLNEIKESHASNNQPQIDDTFHPGLKKIPKLRIRNPYLPMEHQNLRDRKIRNNADIVPKSQHPISDPLLGHQNLAEDFYENAPKEYLFISDIRDSYPFAFVSSENLKTPYQVENEISDVVSNIVKWAYMEKAYGYPLRHERNKLSVTLVQNQKSIEQINLDKMYLAKKQKNIHKRYKCELKANLRSSELTLFEVIYLTYLKKWRNQI